MRDEHRGPLHLCAVHAGEPVPERSEDRVAEITDDHLALVDIEGHPPGMLVWRGKRCHVASLRDVHDGRPPLARACHLLPGPLIQKVMQIHPRVAMQRKVRGRDDLITAGPIPWGRGALYT